jgi:hypothetical protein
MKRVFLAAALAFMLAGCSWSGEQRQAYAFARLHDLVDVAHVDGTLNSFGALANVGPVMLGYQQALLGSPDIGWPVLRGRLGLLFADLTVEDDKAYGLLVPWSRRRVERPFSSGRGGSAYGRKAPAWGSVGFDVGLFIGVGAHVDIVELADFVSGFFGADICKDD